MTSILALVLALAGSAYAGATIGSDDVIKGSLTGRDIKNNTLTAKDIRAEAVRLVKGFTTSCDDPGPEVGKFCHYHDAWWENKESGYERAGFFEDSSGVVHLQGSVRTRGAGSGPWIFLLPPKYRPDRLRLFSVYDSSASADIGYVSIGPDGFVLHHDGQQLTTATPLLQLDGISFRP